ncbi:hypothetical protein [Polaromonas sp. A23]|uniref:hypothetical protein n=1 Tax=Polaromonas sp. A23 TaxID=1944133 RepID=UPI000985060B|nr:hypothetical protein [Polaromonas sp. A23]OOG39092.1 hypothetical protein B0B52_15895 [Polaromonas sp. A23]
MEQFTHLKLRGWLGIVLIIVATGVAGIMFFLLGLNGLQSGEIVIQFKGHAAATATADGPNASAFHTEVWGFMLIGAFFMCCSLAVILRLLFVSRARRDETIRMIGAMRASGGSDAVPGWAVAVVLIGLVSTFVFIAFRFS